MRALPQWDHPPVGQADLHPSQTTAVQRQPQTRHGRLVDPGHYPWEHSCWASVSRHADHVVRPRRLPSPEHSTFRPHHRNRCRPAHRCLPTSIALVLTPAGGRRYRSPVLLQFAVENFRSFHGETVFSMLAPPGDAAASVEIPGYPSLRVMRVAALYGANASGKSNLVKAISAITSLIVEGTTPGDRLPAAPFRLDEAAAQRPSRCQVDFVAQGERYSYMLEFSAEQVCAEALYQVTLSGQEELVFERSAIEGKEHDVKLGRLLSSGGKGRRQFARFVAKGTRPNQPLLTEFAQRNVSEVERAHGWFEHFITVIGADVPFLPLLSHLRSNNDFRAFYCDRLKAMGTGINAVEVLSRPDSNAKAWIDRVTKASKDGGVPAELLHLIAKVGHAPEGHAVDVESDEAVVHELLFHHRTREGGLEKFRLADESDGTRRLLHLLPVIFYAATSQRTFVIDELDRSLHTALTRRFVSDFLMSCNAATAPSQLIFTTHDTNLLNGSLLPPASIWFVEKDSAGASHIHSLAEYKHDQVDILLKDLEAGYLQGRFGAIPFFSDRGRLSSWGDCKSEANE